MPRLFLVEAELMRELLVAELAYVRRLVENLRAERIDWSDALSLPP